MERGDEVIILKKEGNIDIEKVTQAQQSNYWRGITEYKVLKRQQQGLDVPRPDSANPDKSLIPDKYNNNMELKRLKRKK